MLSKNIPQNSSSTATNLPSQKPSKLDEDMRHTAGEVSDVLLWTPSHRGESVGRPARTYLLQLCKECNLEAMDYWDEWRERVREICASDSTWWYDDDDDDDIIKNSEIWSFEAQIFKF